MATTRERTSVPESAPEKKSNLGRNTLILVGATVVSAAVGVAMVGNSINAQGGNSLTLNEVQQRLDNEQAAIDGQSTNSQENSVVAPGVAETENEAVNIDENEIPSVIVVNGYELPNLIELNKDTPSVKGAAVDVSAEILETSLEFSDKEFLSSAGFAEKRPGADALYDRFKDYAGREDFYVSLSFDGENRPEQIQDVTPSGFATLASGDFMSGFKYEIVDINSKEVLDRQWVLATFTQEGVNEQLGWGMLSISLLEES